MTPWSTWASAVLQGVNAPANDTNAGTLWAWSGAESLPRDRMSWCNPLNTTEPWPGSGDMNTVGVKRYASVQNGIDATVATLLNGHYPVILANLRASLPRAQWGLACANLGTWGTGCTWLATNYGSLPDSFGGANVAEADDVYNVLVKNGSTQGGSVSWLAKTLADIRAQLDGGVAPADVSALTAAVKSLSTAVAVLDGKVNRILKELNTP